MKKPKVLLIILDGYGKAPKSKGNAVELAKKPFIDKLRDEYPTTLLKAHGNAVGLPHGYMGNSEVGHFTIGAGRIVFQSFETINQEIKNRTFFKNKPLISAFSHAKKYRKKLHLLGMISNKGVHAHLQHLLALLQMAKKNQISDVWIHAITDGRDVHEKSAQKYIRQIEKECRRLKIGKIATIIGRFYAMDRDKNWQRTQAAYDLITAGQGARETDSQKAIDHAYESGAATDYYIKPIILDKKGLIEKNDAIIFFNFRTDRAAQLASSLSEKNFREFPVQKLENHLICLGPYSKICPIAYPAPKIKNTLGETISQAGLKQLRIAETEKYAHVTFFFNSQIKEPYQGEKQILVPSPKVPSYAQKPEMSAAAITKKLLHEIHKVDDFDFVALNYANGDLVGHSGELKPTIKCIETLNSCLEKLIPVALKDGYDIILTADHGNAERMYYEDGSPCPAHSCNPVECTILTPLGKKLKLRANGGLSDIAPTVLKLLHLKKPKEMSGVSLIKKE